MLRHKPFFALVLIIVLAMPAFASVHNGRPKLVVVIIIDQFRGDYLERYRDRFVPDGFRLLMDKGAWFSECYYDYANLHTAPGHATLGTGAYTNGHGIIGNEWYDPERDEMVTSVFDPAQKVVGIGEGAAGASPHNLQADTFADEVRLATNGRSRVFSVSLKDRSAILPAGYSANAAYWIEKDTGGMQTSTYYMKSLPDWAARFNQEKRFDKYWDREWKDATGNVLRKTNRQPGSALGFYEIVGSTPFANDYQLEFTRELIQQEQLGQRDTTDVLVLSLSAFDILGHEVGPNAPQLDAMTLQLDKQLADFFGFLGRQVGLANVWIALSADHGITYMQDDLKKLHIPATRNNGETNYAKLNMAISKRFPKLPVTDYVKAVQFPYIYLSKSNFEKAGVKDEQQAEKIVGEEALKLDGVRNYYTRAQLARGEVPNDDTGRKYVNSYSALTTWYVQLRFEPFLTDYGTSVSHMMPYSYDTHVPLMFYGLPFQPGQYRTHAEPIDMAVTLTSLLGTNKPTHAVGRVLTEAFK
jgi:predicted AlkP superfamily pyrophosphatase or phosphodiesterase